MRQDYKLLEAFVSLMIDHNHTLMTAEEEYRRSHSTLHWFVHHILKKQNPTLYREAVALFERHKRERKRKK